MNDRRCFSRYVQSNELTFLYGSQSFHATTIDYSLNGLAAKIDGHPEIKHGDVINFSPAGDEELDTGKVAWTRRDNGALKVGLIKVGMLHGSLGRYALADVLIGVHRAMMSGRLYVIDRDSMRAVTFKDGDIAFAASNHPSERFLDSLVLDEIVTG